MAEEMTQLAIQRANNLVVMAKCGVEMAESRLQSDYFYNPHSMIIVDGCTDEENREINAEGRAAFDFAFKGAMRKKIVAAELEANWRRRELQRLFGDGNLSTSTVADHIAFLQTQIAELETLPQDMPAPYRYQLQPFGSSLHFGSIELRPRDEALTRVTGAFLIGRDMELYVDGKKADGGPGIMTRIEISPIERDEPVTVSITYLAQPGQPSSDSVEAREAIENDCAV